MNCNVLKRVSAVLLAMFVAFGMMCFSTWETKAADNWELSSPDTFYVGQREFYLDVGNYDDASGETDWATITSAKSSKKSVVKIKSDTWEGEDGNPVKAYSMKFLKAGKAKITVNFQKSNGSAGSITKSVTVKKYPNQIKSLKVNGKTIKTSKGIKRYEYYVTKFKKSKVNVKMALKKGWKISDVYVSVYNSKNGKSKDIKVKKSAVKKGTGIKLPKGYDNMNINIYMSKGKQEISYYIGVSKNKY